MSSICCRLSCLTSKEEWISAAVEFCRIRDLSALVVMAIFPDTANGVSSTIGRELGLFLPLHAAASIDGERLLTHPSVVSAAGWEDSAKAATLQNENGEWWSLPQPNIRAVENNLAPYSLQHYGRREPRVHIDCSFDNSRLRGAKDQSGLQDRLVSFTFFQLPLKLSSKEATKTPQYRALTSTALFTMTFTLLRLSL